MKERGVFKKTLVLCLLVALCLIMASSVFGLALNGQTQNGNYYDNGTLNITKGGLTAVKYIINVSNDDSYAYKCIKLGYTDSYTYNASCGSTNAELAASCGKNTGNIIKYTSATGFTNTVLINASFNTSSSYNGTVSWDVETYSNIGCTLNTSVTSFTTGIDSSRPASFGTYASNTTGYDGNKWLVGDVTVTCSGATDTVSGVNATSYNFFNGSSASVKVNRTNIAPTMTFNSTDVSDTSSGYFLGCNVSDNVANSAALNYTKFYGIDNTVPAYSTPEINDTDRVMKLTHYVNLTINWTDSSSIFNATVQGANLNTSGTGPIYLMTTPTGNGGSTPGGENFTKSGITAATLCNVSTGTETTCQISFAARDNATNSNISNMNIYVDGLAPRVAFAGIDERLNDLYFQTNVSLDISLTIAEQNVTVNDLIIRNGTEGKGSIGLTVLGAVMVNDTVNLTSLGITTHGASRTLLMNVSDIAGNRNDTVTLTVYADLRTPNVTSPTATTTVGGKGFGTADSVLNITATINEESSLLLAAINGSSGTQVLLGNKTSATSYYNDTVNVSTLCGTSDGTCTIRFNATDYAFNTNTTETATFIVDGTTPGIRSGAVNGSGSYFTRTAELNFTVNVTDTYIFAVNLTSNRTTNVNVTTVTTGDHSNAGNFSKLLKVQNICNVSSASEHACLVTFTAYDNASNSNTTTLTIFADDVAPRVSGVLINGLATDTVTSAQTLNITFTVADLNVSTVKIANTTRTQFGTTLYGTTTYSNTTINASILGCSSGTCTVTLNATDQVGNYNETITLAFTVDDTAPAITVNGPTGTITDNTPLLNVSTNKNSNCRYSTTDVPYANMALLNFTGNAAGEEHTVTLATLTDSTYTYFVRCADQGGTAVSYSSMISFVLDTTGNFNYTQPDDSDGYFETGWNLLWMPSMTVLGTMGYNTSNTATVRNISYFLETTGKLGSNFSIVYYNTDGTDSGWKYYQRGNWSTSNLKYINNTNDNPYWINLTTSNERFEI